MTTGSESGFKAIMLRDPEQNTNVQVPWGNQGKGSVIQRTVTSRAGSTKTQPAMDHKRHRLRPTHKINPNCPLSASEFSSLTSELGRKESQGWLWNKMSQCSVVS
ncbi:hypothetical protein AOLI_G00066310 [Acnodon oligacanthus]